MAKRTETFTRGGITVKVTLKTSTPSVSMPREDRMFLNSVLDTLEAWRRPSASKP